MTRTPDPKDGAPYFFHFLRFFGVFLAILCVALFIFSLTAGA